MSGSFIKRRIHAFSCALRGVYFAFTTQFNYIIHLSVTVLVNLAAWYFELSAFEWMLIWLCIGFVLCAETVNTAIEKMVDLAEPKHNPAAGLVKDIAAGAVLIAAISSAVVGFIIFLPRLAELFK
jgi:diacylglycerol kinase